MAKGKSSNRVDTLALKPSEMRVALSHLTKCLQAAFIWGPPGIGKSQLLKAIAAELGMKFVDIRLSQLDPTDLRGIPYPAKDEFGNDCMNWSPPSFFNRNHDEATLYLFDEMNTAPQAIQAAAYQFVLDRRLGEFELGPQDAVFAAGNRETDKGATFKMPTPLMNRFVHLEMRVDFEDWQTWALESMIHKDVVGYLTFAKNELFDFDPTSASRGFCTPRSWEFVARLINNDPNLPEAVMLGMIAGSVGEGTAVKFMEYRKNAAQLPNPSDILAGKIKDLKAKETSVMYALTTGLCYELKLNHEEVQKASSGTKKKAEDAWNQMADNFLGYMMRNFSPEMVILGARTALSLFRLPFDPTKMKNWDDFAEEYQDLILKA